MVWHQFLLVKSIPQILIRTILKPCTVFVWLQNLEVEKKICYQSRLNTFKLELHSKDYHTF